MKNLLFLLGTSLLLVIIISFCTTAKDTDISPNTEEFDVRLIENLVADYNKQNLKTYGNNMPFIKKAFLTKGLLESDQLKKEEGQLFQAFIFSESDEKGIVNKKTKFEFGLDAAAEIPKKIKNAQIAFIGNQLIIRDLDNNFQINLFVKSTKHPVNKTPSINTIEGAYLGIEAVPDLESRTILSGCTCTCVACAPPPANCGSAECDCGCSTSFCSITCRDNYNATCKSSGGCQ